MTISLGYESVREKVTAKGYGTAPILPCRNSALDCFIVHPRSIRDVP